MGVRGRSIVALAFASLALRGLAETRVVVAGARYEAGGLHRLFWGADYRDLWARPVTVEVLDLATFAGGLSPVRRVGGQQTKGLALRGGDGRNWTFRGLDKDPVSVLPPDLQDTIAASIVRDQIAASHPAAALVADPLLAAAGVLNAEHRLVVMPDDAALGEFRTAFASLVGTIEEYPGAVSGENPGFHGATEIIDHLELYRRMAANPSERADAPALLRARLMDVFLGDWDRHRIQWRWARLPGKDTWQPIPEDRDQAFSRFEGLVLGIARQRQPRFVSFGPAYPSIPGLTFNGSEQDRWLLTGLDRAVWDAITADLRGRLTDAVLDAAVARLPPEYRQADGARMVRDLRRRRDRLGEAATAFYRHLAREVDVRLTDTAEAVEVQRAANGDLSLRVYPRRDDGGERGEPFFSRVFHAGETKEVRLYLGAGDDSVSTTGRNGGPTLRVIAGPGYDSLDDSHGGGTRFYAKGAARLTAGRGTKNTDRMYTPPAPNPRAPWIPPRDWGSRTLIDSWLAGGPDVGAFLGASLTREALGFRRHPWASRQVLRGGYSTEARRPRFDYSGQFRSESGTLTRLFASASGIEVLRFYGFGNETSAARPDRFFRLNQAQYRLEPSLQFFLARPLSVSVGPVLKFTTTELDPTRLIGQLRPYGSEDFGQLGGMLGFALDTRDQDSAPTRGILIRGEGRIHPKLWSVEETFGTVSGLVTAHLTAGASPLRPTLALRAGGVRVFGDHPFHESAFLGGPDSVRGLRGQRFAGDASLFGGAELRLRLAAIRLLLPGEIGILGLAETGRVYVEGESSRDWHRSWGGGLWLSFLERRSTVSFEVAKSEERTGYYVHAGFAF